MIKQSDIFNKIKAYLWLVLVFCFALSAYSQNAFAGQTYSSAPSQTVSSSQGDAASSEGCSKARMDSIYKSGCYACDVVTALISSFLSACTYLYDISKEAGTKILYIGIMLWIAFYILQQLASLKNIEPAAMVNDLLIMAFKVLGAYLVINAGVDFFIRFAVVPFMNFGSEFGIQMLASSQSVSGLDINSVKVDSAYSFSGNVLPESFMNNLLKYIAAVDYTVSTHMEIGHMLTCHSTHAGAYKWLHVIPNIWLWLSGAFIWFSGFMMTLSVAYYLVDISFKLGFAIIALPITVGLWPFNITKGKVASCFSIILKSAGILIFLAMTVSAGLALVDASLGSKAVNSSIESVNQADGGTDKIMTAIENSDTEYVSEYFSFWKFAWIIILFAYLFAIKLIGSTMSDYVDKFFPDQVFSSASPMHMQLTKATDMAKKTAMKPIKFTGKVVAHQSGKLAKKAGALVSRGIGRVATGIFMRKNKNNQGIMDRAKNLNNKIDQLSQGNFNNEQNNQNKQQSMAQSAKSMAGLNADKDQQAMKGQTNGNSGSGSGAGQAMQQTGQAMKESGRQIKEAADNIDQNLANAQQSVQSGNQAVTAAAHAGTAASFGIAAPVTETAAAASNTASAASSAAISAGRVAATSMKTVGDVLEKTGETLEQTGKAVEKGEKIINKASGAADSATKLADAIDKTGNDALGANADPQSQSDDMIGSAADNLLGGNNKKK